MTTQDIYNYNLSSDSDSSNRNHRAEREILWENAGNTEPLGRNMRRVIIVDSDYFAAPPLSGLPSSLAGNCLIWKWTLNKDGYGKAGKNQAHRLAYLQARGKDPQTTKPHKLDVRHLCDRPYCVQPSHLYLHSKKPLSNKKTGSIWDNNSSGQQDVELSLEEKEAMAQKMGGFAWYSATISPSQYAQPTHQPRQDSDFRPISQLSNRNFQAPTANYRMVLPPARQGELDEAIAQSLVRSHSRPPGTALSGNPTSYRVAL